MRPLSHLDETDCIARAQRGEVAAFSELVARYQERIYRFLLRMTRSQEDARELAQETFLNAYQALPRWRADARLSTWLFRIARNQALDRLRRARHVAFVPLDEVLTEQLPADAPTPEAALQARQRVAALEAALAQLPVEHREILLLRDIENLPYEDIAEVLGIRLGTVKSRIARARAGLLQHMPR
ncbi:sigma-70 family RNA polymerase sigma factor [Pulveribacter sp.]|uniref:sigma-70 family RNA polymerase sigma factor n=1 Tax=Pulveribacter sp. TaxID=2678893 RepID=UPI0028B01B8C|nr:sigma-70 family RNA polymerase sigma factor [Pulveribacter sp.]